MCIRDRFERERSGKGQWVQTSLLQSIIAMMDFQAARVLKDGDVPKQMGNDHPTSVPTGVFKTKDGHINIAASGGVLYERFCTSIGRSDLVEDPRFIGFQERSDNRDALREEIEGETQKETSKHWVDMMQEVGVPCGPIYNMGDVFDDPQVKHLGMAWPMKGGSAGDFPVVKTPIIMSRTKQADEVRLPTPDLSQHTEEVLKDMGYDAEAIADLKERNIV